MLMVENPQFVFDVVAMVLFSTLGILFFGLFFIKPLLKITQIPRSIMMPLIFVLCVIGSYALSSRLFDVYTMLGFGALIFVMRRYGYPAAPFVLGIVLGDILDKNLRRGLVLSDGDILPFITRPLSALLALLVHLHLRHQRPVRSCGRDALADGAVRRAWRAASAGPPDAHLALQRGDRRTAVRAAVRACRRARLRRARACAVHVRRAIRRS